MMHRGTERDRHGLRAAGLSVLLLLAQPAVAAPSRPPTIPDHSAFDALLRKYVSDGGVRYRAWHAHPADRAALASYIARMQDIDVSALAAGPGGRDVQLAFWLNLYNAATLDLVLSGYPVKSIRDLGEGEASPWERRVVTVEGKKLSLNAIENDVIRPAFAEPRIHFALNCAATSCPPLRAGAYRADSLASQLEEQTKDFVTNRTRFDGKTLALSKIFDWYAEDFAAAAGSVSAWVRTYVPALGAGPGTGGVALTHTEYDWSLNEAPAP